jgi:hypothetical protein
MNIITNIINFRLKVVKNKKNIIKLKAMNSIAKRADCIITIITTINDIKIVSILVKKLEKILLEKSIKGKTIVSTEAKLF